jgi:hypothetical protein
MKKTFLFFCLLSGYILPSSAQSIWAGFDDQLLPDTNMDYTMTIDTGNYSFNPSSFITWNETKLYGRKETDSTYSGFTYSNIQNNTTPGRINDRAAYPAIGADNSPQYGIAHGIDNGMYVDLYIGIKPTNAAHVYHTYITNATTTVLSMENGDSTAKKFGGADGTDPDWLLLTIKGYTYHWTPDSAQLVDSIQVYLADYRSADSTEDYILKTWQQVDLTEFGKIDSLSFHLTSSDTDSAGMKTPAYFCIDNFEIEFVGGIHENRKNTLDVSVYPNPAKDVLYIKAKVPVSAKVFDISGRLKMESHIKDGELIDIADLPAGIYLVKITDEKSKQSSSFTFTKTL